MMYTGTSTEQDNRFSDKEKKLLRQMRFGDNLSQKVNMSKVKLEVIKPWITQRITEILGIEDEVIIEFVYSQLEDEQHPDPKKMQINMTGFLNGKNARLFMADLWDLLLSAQESPTGIPAKLIEKKKEEIKRKMDEHEKRYETLKLKMDKEKEKEEKHRKHVKEISPESSFLAVTKMEQSHSSSASPSPPKSRSGSHSPAESDLVKAEKVSVAEETSSRQEAKHAGKHSSYKRPHSPEQRTRRSRSPTKQKASTQPSDSSSNYNSDSASEESGADTEDVCDDFEVQRKEDSIQNKRHYRSNRDDDVSSHSDSSIDREKRRYKDSQRHSKSRHKSKSSHERREDHVHMGHLRSGRTSHKARDRYRDAEQDGHPRHSSEKARKKHKCKDRDHRREHVQTSSRHKSSGRSRKPSNEKHSSRKRSRSPKRASSHSLHNISHSLSRTPSPFRKSHYNSDSYSRKENVTLRAKEDDFNMEATFIPTRDELLRRDRKSSTGKSKSYRQ